MPIEDSNVRELGITSANIRCLLLLPLAYVVWSSRARDPRAIDRLLETTVAQAKLDAESHELARRWLRDAPTPVQLRSGVELLRELARAADEPLISPADCLESLVWAGCAAELDREPPGHGHARVSTNARRAMGELATWLDVDVGDLWGDVLAELGEELPRSGNSLAPRFQTLPDSSREVPPPLVESPLAAFAFARANAAADPGVPASIPFLLVRRAAS